MSDNDIEIKDVPLKDNRSRMVEVISEEHSKITESDGGFKQAAITGGTAAPPRMLLYTEARETPAVFDMKFMEGCSTPMLVSLRLKADPKYLQAGVIPFDEEIPLRILPFKTPKDPSLCFDIKACKKIDKVNEVIEAHNKFIVNLLSVFIAQNGCGTSANHVTLPSPAIDLAETRVTRIKELKADKCGYMILAVQYLAREHFLFAIKDFPIETAITLAESLSMEAEIKRKVAKGKVYVKIPGAPRCTWTGNPDDKDSMGRTLRWKATDAHTFLCPDVIPERVELQLIDPIHEYDIK